MVDTQAKSRRNIARQRRIDVRIRNQQFTWLLAEYANTHLCIYWTDRAAWQGEGGGDSLEIQKRIARGTLRRAQRHECVEFWHEQHIHVPATVDALTRRRQWLRSNFRFGGREAVLSLSVWMPLACRSAYSRVPLFGELSRVERRPALSQKGIVSFKVHRFVDLSRDRSEGWTLWKDASEQSARYRTAISFLPS